jgi:hypothetical protein
MPWNALECLGMPWNALECLGMPWNALECLGMPWNALECLGYILIEPRQLLINDISYRVSNENTYHLEKNRVDIPGGISGDILTFLVDLYIKASN